MKLARYVVIGALFAIPFLPLYVSNTLFFPFITGKAFAFRILVEVALIAYVALALFDQRYRPRFSLALVSFGLLAVWMAIANAFGVNPLKAFWSNFERMDGWVTLIHLFALFVVAGAVLTVDRLWRRWWLFFVSVAGAVCAYGVLQLLGAAEIHQGGVRVDASFGNAIYLAVYLMFSILVAAWLSVTSKGWLRYSLIAFMAVAAVVLFYTASRGALIGLGVGAASAAVLWLALGRKEWMQKKGALGIKVAAGTLVALTIIVGGFFLARDSAFVENEPALARLSTIFSLNEELKVRTTIWGMALEGVQEDLLTGWGQEGFNYVFNTYYDPSLYRQEPWFDRAHNMYVDWLVAGGVPALAFFIALLVTSFIAVLRAPGLSREERVLFAGALVAYGVQAIVAFDNLFSYVPLVMILAFIHGTVSRPVAVLQELPEVRAESMRNGLVGVGAVIALATVWSVNVPHMQAANHLVYAISPSPNIATNISLFKQAINDGSFGNQEIREQLVTYASQVSRDERVPENLRTELVTLAAEEMEKQVAIQSRDARLRVQYANALEQVGDQEGALAQLDEAIVLSPKKQTLHIMRGFKLYELGRTAEAETAFRFAYELDTSMDQVAISSAAGLIAMGNITEGKALLMDALGTTTPHSPALFYAYYQAKQWNELVLVARQGVIDAEGAPEARYRLAQALAAASRFNEARMEVNATMEAFPETKAQGEALLNQIFRSVR